MYALRANFGLTVDDVAEAPLRGEMTYVPITEEDEDEEDPAALAKLAQVAKGDHHRT